MRIKSIACLFRVGEDVFELTCHSVDCISFLFLELLLAICLRLPSVPSVLGLTPIALYTLCAIYSFIKRELLVKRECWFISPESISDSQLPRSKYKIS